MQTAERADAVYACLCSYLDGKGYAYQKDETERTVWIEITGEDFPIVTLFRVEEEHERLFVFGKIPFAVKKEKAVDLVMAVTYINQVVAHGAFCVDAERGYCSYEVSELYAGVSGFSERYAERVVQSALSTADTYNEKLFAVNKGLLSVKELAAQL